MQWAVGTKVGNYEILEMIGRGGMGRVYKVRHVISQRVEAMKVLLSTGDAQQGQMPRFLREIRVLAALSHPNIATLHTAFQHNDEFVMVMEFVDGHDLCHHLATGISLQQVVSVMRQILSALEYAHSQGVLHRDIKPSNIMLTTSFTVKLLDFGLARNDPANRVTETGSVLGSIHYISPEQIRGEQLDGRSDLYSVGVTLYEAITGRLPFPGTGFAEVFAGHLSRVPAAPSSLNPEIPAALSSIVMRTLAKRREDRFQSAAEFTEALSGLELEGTSSLLVCPTIEVPQNRAYKSPTPSGSARYDHAVLDDISSQLARHVGPIARVLVKRASGNAGNIRQLCEAVAKEIDSEKAREDFLAHVRKHLYE